MYKSILAMLGYFLMISPSFANNTCHSEIINNIKDVNDLSSKFIISKGGDWKSAPENSILSFQHAVSLGAKIIEVDVQKTKDNQFIVFRDNNLQRMTNGYGNVKDYSLQELKSFNLREYKGNNTKISPEKIPSLYELVSEFENTCVLISINSPWNYSADIYNELVEYGLISNVVFRNAPSIAAAEEFMDMDAKINYFHSINSELDHPNNFERHRPLAFFVNMTNLREEWVMPPFLEDIVNYGRVIYQTYDINLTPFPEGGNYLKPEDYWGWLTQFLHGTILSTELVEDAVSFINNETLKHLSDGSIIIHTSDFGYEGINKSYYDMTMVNMDKAARPIDVVDFCNELDSIYVCDTYAGEWIKYIVNIPQPGMYEIFIRSAQASDDVNVSLEFSESIEFSKILTNTGGKPAFIEDSIGLDYFDIGDHEFILQFKEGNGSEVHSIRFVPQ